MDDGIDQCCLSGMGRRAFWATYCVPVPGLHQLLVVLSHQHSSSINLKTQGVLPGAAAVWARIIKDMGVLSISNRDNYEACCRRPDVAMVRTCAGVTCGSCVSGPPR